MRARVWQGRARSPLQEADERGGSPAWWAAQRRGARAGRHLAPCSLRLRTRGLGSGGTGGCGGGGGGGWALPGEWRGRGGEFFRVRPPETGWGSVRRSWRTRRRPVGRGAAHDRGGGKSKKKKVMEHRPRPAKRPTAVWRPKQPTAAAAAVAGVRGETTPI